MKIIIKHDLNYYLGEMDIQSSNMYMPQMAHIYIQMLSVSDGGLCDH